VHPVGSYCTSVSRCMIHETLNFSRHHSLVVFDECISCLLVAFCASSPQLINSRPVSSVFVSIFAVFYPMPPTAGTHAHFSIKITVIWQILKVNYAQFSDRMSAKQSTVDSHFVTVVCGYILVRMCWTSVSGLGWMTLPARYTACNMMPLVAFSTGLV
jgi:hypothetical protein